MNMQQSTGNPAYSNWSYSVGLATCNRRGSMCLVACALSHRRRPASAKEENVVGRTLATLEVVAVVSQVPVLDRSTEHGHGRTTKPTSRRTL
jgi:hypothetical protein